ncbi:hypothetical protein [Microbacterium sp. SORGH_AS_0888]|uniref:DUF6993 domain-containing protein n=1 Tax=Microbacterium sp. SORGH_AS_0888 TaxID=3041791 RepID=UPI00277F8D69|nr:hypothetical protein [Microbacterium sp. SORGH_AS_0888]MDQ1128755.1 hypothetical protein [Microbacterium sp. SORGH_AS_0888]
MTSPRFRSVVSAGAVALTIVIAGCSSPQPVVPTETPTLSDTPTPAATVPAAPALVPEGSAAQNLPYFTQIVQQVWAGPDQVHGRAYIDALVAAGFPKQSMQVTPDESTVGNPAESIQFSVLWRDGQCLIGQVGPATGSAVAVVEPAVLGGSACLLGTTRPIDW